LLERGFLTNVKRGPAFFVEDVGDAVDDDDEEEDNAGVWFNNVSFRCNVVRQYNCFIPCPHINPDTVNSITRHNTIAPMSMIMLIVFPRVVVCFFFFSDEKTNFRFMFVSWCVCCWMIYTPTDCYYTDGVVESYKQKQNNVLEHTHILSVTLDSTECCDVTVLDKHRVFNRVLCMKEVDAW
jgi:hypothetical protein